MDFIYRMYEEDKDKKYIMDKLRDEKVMSALNLVGTPKESDILDLNQWSFLLIVERGYHAGIPTSTVGFAKVSYSSRGNRGYLDKIFVDETYRKKGVGSSMVDKCLRLAKTYWNCASFYALTIENRGMDLLLEKSEFQKKGVYKDFIYRDGKYRDQTLWLYDF